MEQDDVAFPCKGCGEVCCNRMGFRSYQSSTDGIFQKQILEEGKAFELGGFYYAVLHFRQARWTDKGLAGNRWHIDCFRCNTCGTILDSDANLLLLGDGSLICNNCTYSCSVCGNKIEDLAILTGDQAFCATCFKCRNCKKKIENLKYARTSQGIFCMECHESLMQRRRKKNHKNGVNNRHKHVAQPPAAQNNTMLLDKSLPSLPASAVPRRELEDDSPPSESYSETPTETVPGRSTTTNSRVKSDQDTENQEIPRAAQKRPPFIRSNSSNERSRERSAPSRDDERKEILVPPFHTNRSSHYSQGSDVSGNGNDFIPMLLDSNTAPGPSPLSRRENFHQSSPSMPEHKPNARDYFNTKNNIVARKPIRDQEDSSRVHHFSDSPNESRHSSQPNSPHIAYQQRGRQMSTDLTENHQKKKDHPGSQTVFTTGQETQREVASGEVVRPRRGDSQQNGAFRLDDVPKNKKTEKKTSRGDNQSPQLETSLPSSKSRSAPASAKEQVKEQQIVLPSHESPRSPRSEAGLSGSPRDVYASRSHTSNDSPASYSSPLTNQLKNLPERGDSLAKGVNNKQTAARRDVDPAATSKLSNSMSGSLDNGQDKPASAPPTTTTSPPTSGNAPVNRNLQKNQDSPFTQHSGETPQPPLRAKDRERMVRPDASSSDSFSTPRAPPHPPMLSHKPHADSVGALKSDGSRTDGQVSPKLSRHGDSGDMIMDENLTRMPDNDGYAEGSGFLKRVSHSVRHARSYSDRGTRSSKEQKWPKSPLPGSQSPFGQDIGSPTVSSPEAREEIAWFRQELRKERQKNAEHEQRLSELESALEAKNAIKRMNNELREKRSTMVVLDTQKEIVVRELEVLTDHIANAKNSGEPFDIGRMSNTVLREFAESLQQLKDSFAPQIEDLTQRRNDLLTEVSELTEMRDKSFQEFEQLSVKNAQLADLNNQLVHQIQELYKANANPTSQDPLRPPPNGLGIYAQHRDRSNATSIDQSSNRPSVAESGMTGSTAIGDQETEPATYLSAPQVVNIRKAQPKKFNWKKGGQNVAKGVTKGLKGAFSSDPYRTRQEGQYTEGIPYGAMSQQEYPSTSFTARQQLDRREGFGGLFGDRKQKPPQWKNSPNGSSPAVHSQDGPCKLRWWKKVSNLLTSPDSFIRIRA